ATGKSGKSALSGTCQLPVAGCRSPVSCSLARLPATSRRWESFTASEVFSAPLHVLEIERLAVDAFCRRGDPVCDLAALVDRLHEAFDVLAVGGARQPVGHPTLVLLGGDELAVDVEGHPGVEADRAVEALRGQAQPLARRTRALDGAVPLVDGALA